MSSSPGPSAKRRNKDVGGRLKRPRPQDAEQRRPSYNRRSRLLGLDDEGIRRFIESPRKRRRRYCRRSLLGREAAFGLWPLAFGGVPGGERTGAGLRMFIRTSDAGDRQRGARTRGSLPDSDLRPGRARVRPRPRRKRVKTPRDSSLLQDSVPRVGLKDVSYRKWFPYLLDS